MFTIIPVFYSCCTDIVNNMDDPLNKETEVKEMDYENGKNSFFTLYFSIVTASRAKHTSQETGFISLCSKML